MQKKALVLTYFGKLPFWFPVFQLSCKYNPDITWIIFTDSLKPKECSDNLIFIALSVDEFSEIASRKIGVKINLSKKFLYKICDFKPAFGLIYEDYLQQYDFWGHCDLDIVWGKIDNFINDEILKKNDIITSRLNRISGHFCLYRNTETVNRFFLNIPFAEQLLQDSDVYRKVDEELFSIYLNTLVNPSWLNRVKNIFSRKKKIRVYWDNILTTSGKHQRELIENDKKYFKWNNGRVYDAAGRELMYIHFHILKNLFGFKKCNIHSDGEDILISPSGIESRFMHMTR